MVVFLVGNTSWKCWKWHLQDSRFQRCLGGGGAYYFLSAIHFKTYWEQIRKVNFWQRRTLNSFCFWGFVPCAPNGLCPCTHWGRQPPPDPWLVWGPSAPVAVYFQNITVYFKSYWQPCFLLSFDWGLSCKLQLIDLITGFAAFLVGRQTILVSFFSRERRNRKETNGWKNKSATGRYRYRFCP